MFRSFAFALMALLLPLFAQGADGPFSQVARFGSAPEIDGKPDDAIWQQTIAISDFHHFGSHRPASEGKTTARFGYDADHLYLLLQCEEPLLLVVSQRLDDVKAVQKENDTAVILDDCALLLLRSKDDSAAFEWVINTNGAFSDARTSSEDLWGKRDLSWQSGARTAVTVSDGFWTAELAIPWKVLGVKPKPGLELDALLSRLVWSRDTHTSWHLTNSIGAHDVAAWGRLKLAEGPLPGVERVDPLATAFQKGENHLTLRLHADPERQWAVTTTVNDATPSHHLLRSEGGKPLKVPFQLGEEGQIRWSWSLRDAASLELLYRSPGMVQVVESGSVVFTLSTEGAYRLHRGDQLIASGERAEAQRIELPLANGINPVTLELESGTARLQWSGTAPEDHLIRWEALPSGSPRNAPPAPLAEQRLENNTLHLGTPGSKAIYRHTFLLRSTDSWPLHSPALHIAGSGVQALFFHPGGFEALPQPEWELHLETPGEVEITAATGYYGNILPEKPKFRLEAQGDHDGQRRYRVIASHPILHRPKWTSIQRLIEVHLRHRIANPSPQIAHPLRFWASAHEGRITERSRTIPLRLLPPLEGLQPKEHRWLMWGGVKVMDEAPALALPLLETMQASGINGFMGNHPIISDLVEKTGVRQWLHVEWAPWEINLDSHLEQHPDERLINHEGKAQAGQLCLTLQIGERWPVCAEAMATYINRYRPAVVSFDYEYPPFIGRQSCYCPRCLDAFATFAQLDKAGLTPETIKEKHDEAWIDFMARRVARLCQLMKEATPALEGKPEFFVYSGYQSERNPRQYGLNWSYIGELKAADLGGAGFGWTPELVAATRQALGGIPLLCGELLHPYLGTWTLNTQTPIPPLSEATLLRRALDGDGGVLIYEIKAMDGRSWQAIAKTTRLIATHERFFGKGIRSEALEGHDPARVQIITQGKEALLCLMNFSREEEIYRIALPEGYTQAAAFFGKAKVQAPAAMEARLAPGESAAFLLTQP